MLFSLFPFLPVSGSDKKPCEWGGLALYLVPATLSPDTSLSCDLYVLHTIPFATILGRNPVFISSPRHCKSEIQKQNKNAFNAC